MKNKKKVFIGIIILLLVISIVGGLLIYFRNSNKLTAVEKRFIADNSTTVQNINVLNNVDVFGNNGVGLFYDFLTDFSDEYGLNVNPVAYNLGEESHDISFGVGNTLNEREIAFYEDHYVLVGKKYEYIKSLEVLNDKKIGVLTSNLSYVSSYMNNEKINFVSYENEEEMLKVFKEQKEIQYIVVPLHLYLNNILSNNYAINYHFSDMIFYYKLNCGENNNLGSILKKYYESWKLKSLEKNYQNHLFELFAKSLNISSTDIDAMRSVAYNYGFINNDPYEVIVGGNYGGILAQYLKEFMEFSDIELKFVKYKNYKQLLKAVNNNKINLYFDYYDLGNTYDSVSSGLGISYSVLASKKNSLVVNSLKALNEETIYVEKDTNLYNYLVNNTKLNIKTYKNRKELEKIVKKKGIIIVDFNIFETYRNSIFNSYSLRYKFNLNKDYSFKIDTNETFIKLFEEFVRYKDPIKTSYKGIYNYEKTIQSGSITGTIAKYFMYLLIAFVLIFLYVYKIAKKAKTNKKLKKEDKLKYIDQLTSLKNRNYLNDNIDSWSKNKIYPQSVIVIELNNLQYINDTMGYEQGDIQIKAVANILVKLQLDNSDIMRTDGNEFVVYLIGYQTKQITSYIHKLNKELKKLPYEYGATIGYSMIEDHLKSVEDAINEAVEEVKKQKESKKEGK